MLISPPTIIVDSSTTKYMCPSHKPLADQPRRRVLQSEGWKYTSYTGWWYAHPSDMKVNWDDDIPNWMEKQKLCSSHHQPVTYIGKSTKRPWNGKHIFQWKLGNFQPPIYHHWTVNKNHTAWWFQPLWRIWVRLGWWTSQDMGKSSSHVPGKPPTSIIVDIIYRWLVIKIIIDL